MSKILRSPAHDLVPKSLMKTIPSYGETSEQLDSMVHIKLFDPAGSWTWYVMEYDPKDRICYGWVCGFEQEFGSFKLAELETIPGPLGRRVERDLFFTPCLLSELPEPHRPGIFEA